MSEGGQRGGDSAPTSVDEADAGAASGTTGGIVDSPTSGGDKSTEKQRQTNPDDAKTASSDAVSPSADTNLPPAMFKMPMIAHRPGIRKRSGGLANVLNEKEKIKIVNKGSNVPAVGNTTKEIPIEVPMVTSENEGDIGCNSVGKEPHTTQSSVATVQMIKQPPIPYKEPEWGSICTKPYALEVVKNGTIVDTIDVTKKSFFVFGRLPSCDVSMEHPSLSRYHAVIQHCGMENEKHSIGWYLYDLDSTHGTWTNKIKVTPRVYRRLRVGHVIKFGGSSRLYILQGPEEDQDDEAELTVTEQKLLREKQAREVEVLRMADMKSQEMANRLSEKTEDEGCSWGFDEADAVEEDMSNPFALTEAKNEDLYIDDPKKGLRGYFEREGLDLPEYEIQDIGRGKYRCMVELPIDSLSGEPIVAEATVSGKKKEAVIACALEACRILDKHGELRKAKHESRARKQKNWEDEDFYDSDDDTFLDRTGDIEKKREKRMKKYGKDEMKVETYESLVSQLTRVENEMTEIQERLDKAKRDAEALEEEGLDALDAYMSSIKSGSNLDSKTKMKLKRQLFDLKAEQQKLLKLANIAKPATLPSLPKTSTQSEAKITTKMMPIFGKKKVISKPVIKTPMISPKTQVYSADQDEEGEEEEEEETKEERTKEKPENCEKSPSTNNLKEEVELETHGCEEKSVSLNDLSCRLHTEQELKKNTETDNVKSITPAIPHDKMEAQSGTSGSRISGDNSNMDMKKETTVEPPVKKKKTIKKFDASQAQSAMTVDDNECTDPDYQAWVPPTGQTGDGRTHLNEKYGY